LKRLRAFVGRLRTSRKNTNSDSEKSISVVSRFTFYKFPAALGTDQRLMIQRDVVAPETERRRVQIEFALLFDFVFFAGLTGAFRTEKL
jgi:hypothetical protein